MSTVEQAYDLIIIGAGQSGLAAAYHAKQKGLSYKVLEAGDTVGHSWHNRYDSLVLFTPRSYSALPGLLFPGDQNGYPSKDETAAYLQQYVEQFGLNIALNEPVTKLTKINDLFTTTTQQGAYQSKAVIVATGPFQTPRTPAWHDKLTIQQMHSADYRNSEQIDGKKVLVVGGGNSGAQIAEELAKDHDVSMAVMGNMRFMPAKILGKSLFWWLDVLGLLNAPTGSFGAKLLQKRGDPVIGGGLKKLIKQGKVTIKPVAKNGNGDTITFGDNTTDIYDAIVWCTGYELTYLWLQILGALDGKGWPRQRVGKAVDVPGLYFLGLSWMRSRNSALIGGVGRDAQDIVGEL